MLKEILAISGKPGLFKLLSAGNNSLIVEQLSDKKRLPVRANERVVSLKEISIYTTEGDKPLGEVLDAVYQYAGGQPVDLKAMGNDKQAYFDYFAQVLPIYDQEMVHANEIKKMLTWYNILLANGFTSFANVEEESSENKEDASEEQAQ